MPQQAVSTATLDPRAAELIEHWFPAELGPDALQQAAERWFQTNPAHDRLLKKRFSAVLELALGGALDSWAATAEGRLALILLLDQISRNVHRGSAEAFGGDGDALRLCLEGLAIGADRELNPLQRMFFYMPLQHSERLEDQERSVAVYKGLAAEGGQSLGATLATCVEHAKQHRDIIARFGRFPHRNWALKREHSAAEREYLDGGGPSFGQ